VNWTEPITDRTQLDVVNRTHKAFLNAQDLNRIEGNMQWLVNILAHRIPVYIFSKTDWDDTMTATTGDIRRICEGITAVKDAFYRPTGYVDIAGLDTKPLDFIDVNGLEMNLYLIKELVDWMIASFRKTVFKSGATLFLPKRRMQ